GRVLGAWRDDEPLDSTAEGARKVVGERARVVDRDRLGDEAERGHEVEDGNVAGVFERNPIARAQVGLQHALDPVEGTADDREGVVREAFPLELAPGEREQRRTIRRLAVKTRTPRGARERSRERREQRRVRVAEREVPQVSRRRRDRPDRERRPWAHTGP